MDKQITNRGYTGHEHLDMFNIINMNGRVYDPLTAMFFSPDPFIQSPENWFNYNRYGYCLNNPTRYIDPTGYQMFPLESPGGSAGRDPRVLGTAYGSENNSILNWYPAYYDAVLHGYIGGTDNFIQQWDDPNFNGTITVHYKAGQVGEKAHSENGFYFSSNLVLIRGTFTINLGKNYDWNGQRGKEINFWGAFNNALLVGSAVNEPAYLRSSLIAKEGKFAVEGWKTYSNAFRGNQYVSALAVREAKAAFTSVAKTASRFSTGLTALSFFATYENHSAGNVSDGRYYVEQTINVIGLFGPWGGGIAIGLGTIDAIWGDQIESAIREK